MGTLETLEFDLSKVEISPTLQSHAPWCWQRPNGSLDFYSHQEVARSVSPSPLSWCPWRPTRQSGLLALSSDNEATCSLLSQWWSHGCSNEVHLPLPSFWTRRYQQKLGGSQKLHIHASVTGSFLPQVSKSGEPGWLPSLAVRRQHCSFSCLSDIKASPPK